MPQKNRLPFIQNIFKNSYLYALKHLATKPFYMELMKATKRIGEFVCVFFVCVCVFLVLLVRESQIRKFNEK